MKTIAELQEWCAAVEDEFGDAAEAVGLLFARFQQCAPTGTGIEQDVVISWDGEQLVLELFGGVPLRLDMNGPRLSLQNDLDAFGVYQVAPGLWHLTPSLNLPGVLHMFVVLYDVPSPAPWERQIITG